MTRNEKIGIGAVIALAFILLLVGVTSLVNHYKDGQFTARQAELQKQLADEKSNAQAKQALADRAAEEGRQKDVEIQQLKTDNEALAKAANEKRIVYVNSRKPVPVRPFDGNATDADVRAAAQRAGLVLHPAP